jgi:hypothetical protein
VKVESHEREEEKSVWGPVEGHFYMSLDLVKPLSSIYQSVRFQPYSYSFTQAFHYLAFFLKNNVTNLVEKLIMWPLCLSHVRDIFLLFLLNSNHFS